MELQKQDRKILFVNVELMYLYSATAIKMQIYFSAIKNSFPKAITYCLSFVLGGKLKSMDCFALYCIFLAKYLTYNKHLIKNVLNEWIKVLNFFH